MFWRGVAYLEGLTFWRRRHFGGGACRVLEGVAFLEGTCSIVVGHGILEGCLHCIDVLEWRGILEGACSVLEECS